MFKKIKIGLSAVAAFAFMFATTFIVAQEKVNDNGNGNTVEISKPEVFKKAEQEAPVKRFAEIRMKTSTDASTQSTVTRYVTGQNQYGDTSPIPGCGADTHYCGFAYNSEDMDEPTARAIAEANYQEAENGEVVSGVTIYKRATLIWNP